MSERPGILELVGSCRLALKLTVAQRKALATLEGHAGLYIGSDDLMLTIWGEVRNIRCLSQLLQGLAAKLRRFGVDIDRKRGLGWSLVLVRERQPWLAAQPGQLSALLQESRR